MATTTGVVTRSRSTVTATSVNGCPTGACGLWTVTIDGLDERAGQHLGGDPVGQRLDEVERLARSIERDDVGGDLGVVDGVGEVVARAGRGEVDAPCSTSTTKVWPSRFSKSRTPWKPRAETPLRTMRSRHRRSCHRAGSRRRERVDASTATSWTRTPQAPCSRARHAWSRRSCRVPLGGRARVGARRRRPSRPRKVLREVPTSTGWPRATTASRWRSSAQLCSARLGEPEPGVEDEVVRRDPAGRAAPSTRSAQLARTRRATTSS